MENYNIQKINQLLEETSNAHFKYEQDILNGRYDEEWNNWYAKYLLEHDLNNFVINSFKVEELAEKLITWNHEFEIQAENTNWTEYILNKMINY